MKPSDLILTPHWNWYDHNERRAVATTLVPV
jgi:gentisate 1,2-dioxygenase